MNFDIKWWCIMAVCWSGDAAGEGWRWPEGVESLRIDTKVRFVEADSGARGQKTSIASNLDISKGDLPNDEIPFQPASDTSGFYNRAGNDGRFPVRVLVSDKNNYKIDDRAVYPINNNNNQSEAIQFCKCVTDPDCSPRPDSAEICGYGKYLCCYKKPSQHSRRHNSEFFNEIDDERPMLFPGKENIGGPFPPPPGNSFSGVFGPGHAHSVVLGAVEPDGTRTRPVLTGPGGPTGIIGPGRGNSRPVLSGPGGPTGVIGPAPDAAHSAHASASAQQGILVGPGGVVGPYNRPVLVGPGGPTGYIGPNRGGSRGILVGPGGPSGMVGPSGGFSRQQGPGLLVGPGGPTGIIGPGRQLLVGPGGPTGIIGPNRYFVTVEVNVGVAKSVTGKSQPWLHPALSKKGISVSENEVITFQTKNTNTVLAKPRVRRAPGSCSRSGCDGQDLLKVHRRKKMPNPNRRNMPFQQHKPINKNPPKYPPPDNRTPVRNPKKISVAKSKKLSLQTIHKLSSGHANEAAVRKAMALRDRAVGEVNVDGRRQFKPKKIIVTRRQKRIRTTAPKTTEIGKSKHKSALRQPKKESNPAAEKIPESPDYRYYPTNETIVDAVTKLVLAPGARRNLDETTTDEYEIVTEVVYTGMSDEFEVEDFAKPLSQVSSTTTEKVTLKPSVFRSLPVFFGAMGFLRVLITFGML